MKLKHPFVESSAGSADVGVSVPSPQEIERRARAIWEEAGSPEGCALDHWLAAERELQLARETAPLAAAKGKPRGNGARN